MSAESLRAHATKADTGTVHPLPRARAHDAFRNRVTIARTWDSLEDFASDAGRAGTFGDSLEGTRSQAWGSAQDSFARGGGAASIVGNGTMATALEMARGGWSGVRADAIEIASRVATLASADAVDTSFETFYDVAGGVVDVGRYLTGAPECMQEVMPVRVAKRGRVARVIVPVAYSCSANMPEITRRGAAVCAMIDALARAHYSLEVWAVSAICASESRGWSRIAYAVKVQDAATPYDAGRVAFGCGHPSFLRRLTFSIEEQECDAMRSKWHVGGGYGCYPYSVVAEDLPEYAQDAPTIVFPELGQRGDYGGVRTWTDDAAVAKWIEDQVRTIAGE